MLKYSILRIHSNLSWRDKAKCCTGRTMRCTTSRTDKEKEKEQEEMDDEMILCKKMQEINIWPTPSVMDTLGHTKSTFNLVLSLH